ncbi:MAG: glycosyltransferase family 4 protein [Candidatus Yanofskybacteria bacterium]|nr:glycosyltransferase family 4 protein [Candidatus Yanofskybacteria bacterium]
MRVGIDIRVLGSQHKSGVEEYTENLLAHMLPENPDIEFKLFYAGDPLLLGKYEWVSLDNVKIVQSSVSNKLIFASSWLFNYPRIDDLVGGVEVFFSPHFLIAPLNPYCRRVMTFHDLSYLRFKEFFSLRRDLWHRFQIKSFGKKNLPDKIIAVSESTKNDLIEKYGIEPDRIEKIYSGIPVMTARPDGEKLEEFRKRNDLSGKFILFLGKLEPRKNIPTLIKAFDHLKDSGKFPDLHLVIVGAKGWLFEDIFREAETSSHKSKIIFKDYIEDEDKKFYYSLASAFVYTSFFEGFGFPPLEAMACGTPVVASNNSSLPEVVGDAGILVDPYNAVDISNGVRAVMEDPNLRTAFIKRGYERVNMFDWKKCAEQTMGAILGK